MSSKNFKKTKLVFVTVLIATALVSAQMPLSDSTGNWEFVTEMSDEFEGELDHAKWDNNVPDWGLWSWEPENAYTENGKMALKMQYDIHTRNGDTLYYTSGIIKTKAEPIQYGYFEAKMKGADRFPGVCPAFWMNMNTADLWTEIDIMEMQENSWKVERMDMNTHTFRPEERHERRHWDAPWDPKDDYHVYACKWDRVGITWYIDGIERAYRKNEHWHQTYDVIYSIGLREPLRETPEKEGFPSVAYCEYIRVWKSTVEDIPVTDITLPGDTIFLNVGEDTTIIAEILPQNAYVKDVDWESSQASIVKHLEGGKIEGKKAGVATITATTRDGEFNDEVIVKVLEVPTVNIQSNNIIPRIKVYPNPVEDGIVYIQSEHFDNPSNITIYSIGGKIVYKDKININRSTLINLKELAGSGFYYLNINGEEYQFNETIIVL